MRRLLAVLVLCSAACAKCGKSPAGAVGGGGVERVLPAGATAYVLVPKVEQLGEKLKLLEGLKVTNFASQAQGYDNAKQYVDAWVAELGIDVRSKEALDKVGVAADRSAGVAVMDDKGTALLALPIKDEGRIGSFLRTFATNRLGASMVEDKVEGAVTVHRLTGAGGPRLAWASANGYVLVSPAFAKVGGWAARAEADTLAKDTSLPQSLGRLPSERDLVIYAPPGSKGVLATPFAHVVMVLSLGPKAFTLTADAPWGGDASSLSLFEPKPGASLLPLLPADAFFVARLGGDATALRPLIGMLLGPNLQRAFKEGGFDVSEQVLGNLKPGSVVGVSLAPTAKMGAGVPELDVRRTNPFSFFHLSGAAAAKSAEAVEPTLQKLAEVAPRFGAQMTLKEGAYVTTYSQGEGVHFAAKGDTVLFASPLSRLDALRSADGTGPGPVADAAMKKSLEASALAAIIDLRKLSDAVRELPVSAWGLGGFAIKATTLRWLDNTDDLEVVTVNIGTKAGAVQAEVKLSLAAKPAAPPPEPGH